MPGSRRPLYDDQASEDFARRQLWLSALSGLAVLIVLGGVALAAFVIRSTDLVILAIVIGLLVLAALVAACFSQLAHLTAFALRRKVH